MKENIEKLKIALESDNIVIVDEILEFIFTSGNFHEKEIDEVDDILQEATLYSELKENDYKNEALKLINEYLW